MSKKFWVSSGNSKSLFHQQTLTGYLPPCIRLDVGRGRVWWDKTPALHYPRPGRHGQWAVSSEGKDLVCITAQSACSICPKKEWMCVHYRTHWDKTRLSGTYVGHSTSIRGWAGRASRGAFRTMTGNVEAKRVGQERTFRQQNRYEQKYWEKWKFTKWREVHIPHTEQLLVL